MFRGLIRRQAFNVLVDPYANAFQRDNSTPGEWAHRDTRTPPYTNWIWEGKYELDSLVYVLKLSVEYYQHTGDATPFDEQWTRAMQRILELVRYQ